jgi:hypothetical protein
VRRCCSQCKQRATTFSLLAGWDQSRTSLTQWRRRAQNSHTTAPASEAPRGRAEGGADSSSRGRQATQTRFLAAKASRKAWRRVASVCRSVAFACVVGRSLSDAPARQVGENTCAQTMWRSSFIHPSRQSPCHSTAQLLARPPHLLLLQPLSLLPLLLRLALLLLALLQPTKLPPQRLLALPTLTMQPRSASMPRQPPLQRPGQPPSRAPRPYPSSLLSCAPRCH